MFDLNTLVAELTGGDDERAEVAAQKLAAYGKESVPILRQLLVSSDTDARWWALRALAEINDPQVVPLLVTGLGDADPGVRGCAALALRGRPEPLAIPDLIRLLGEGNALLARLAADALTVIGSEAVPALLAVMENGPQVGRLEAVRALALIGDQRAIPALFAALDEDSALLEYWASEGLERMGVGMVFFKP